MLLLFSHPPNRVQVFASPWTAAHQSSLSFTISWSLPKFMFTALVMLSSHLILWYLLLLLPSIFPSIRDFSSDSSVHIRWPKYWSFSFSISPSSEYSGLISFRISFRVDLLAVQGTFRSLLQHHSLKASILWHSAFFTVQVSQPYVTTGKPCGLDYSHGLDYTDLCRQSKCLCFSTHCLGLSSLSCQETVVFWLHGCSHRLWWFWSQRRGDLSLLPLFPPVFAMK